MVDSLSLQAAPYVAPAASTAPAPPVVEFAVLDRAAPDVAARLRAELGPTDGPRLAATLFFVMGVLRGTAPWPGDSVGLALTSAGRDDLRAQLSKDVKELRRLAADTVGEWRIYTLPVLDEAAVQPIHLYVRQRGDDASGGKADERGQRFVLDPDMSRLGPLQLDGLVRRGRFDLVLRSRQAFTPAMQTDIAAIFRAALDGSGFAGDIAFVTARRFPVAPLDALRPRLGLQI